MKKRLICLIAALLLLTGGATTALAADPVAEPAGQEERTAQENALRGLGLLEGETQYAWELAYETFYSGFPGIETGDLSAAQGTVQMALTYPTYTSAGGWTDWLRKEPPPWGNAVLAADDGSYLGTEDLYARNVPPYHVQPTWYAPEELLRITPELERILLERYYAPQDTQARAVAFSGATGQLEAVQMSDGMGTIFIVTSLSENGKAQIIDWKNPEKSLWDWGKLATWFYQQKLLGVDPPVEGDEPAPGNEPNPGTGKPVIYLYPEQPTDVSVKLDYRGPFTYTYPAYQNGWRVTAHPDGRLVDQSGNEYYYLFWEGNEKLDWDFSKGFVVPGTQTVSFLQEKLELLGLNAREMNDFITYWAPEMSRNDSNLITFSYEQYEALAPLTVTPAPDTVLRVHMVYKRYDGGPVPAPQVLTSTERSGFTVVEWGGTRA